MRHYRKDIYDANVYKKHDKLSDDIREMPEGDEKTAMLQLFIKDIEKDILLTEQLIQPMIVKLFG